MSNSFGVILGIVAGLAFLGVMSMDSQPGDRKAKTEPYRPPERTNPLTENNFSFKPQQSDASPRRVKSKSPKSVRKSPKSVR